MSFRFILVMLVVFTAGCSIFRSTDLDENDAGVVESDMMVADAGATDASDPVSGDGGPTDTPDVGADLPSNDSDAAGDVGADREIGTADDMGAEDDMGTVGSTYCPLPVDLSDTSNPDVVVGSGSADSCTEEGIQNALDSGGIVTFNCGGAAVVTVTKPLEVTRDVVLDGGGEITLSGGGTTQIMRLVVDRASSRPEVTLQGLTFRDGFNDVDMGACGAGLYRVGGELDLIDVKFLNNSCPNADGGGLWSRGDHPIRLVRTSFTSNSALNGGGVVSAHGKMTIVDSSFSGNNVSKDGGSIYGLNGIMDICGSRFRSNTADNWAGGLMFTFGGAADQYVAVEHSVFAENQAGDASGAIYIYGARDVRIGNTSIVDNTSNGAGGARIQQSAIDIENVTIARNVAVAGQTGGLLIEDTSGRIAHATIADNETLDSLTFNAGIGGSGVVDISNTIISDNWGANIYANQNCSQTHDGLGGNLQYPRNRDDGNPDNECTDDVIFADPVLTESLDGLTYKPGTGSPAIGLGVDCSSTDQLGTTRPAQGCTAGAVEVP